MIRYQLPTSWIRYDYRAVAQALIEVKSVVLSLKTMPHQRSWVENLQEVELRREVAGTSKIEGAYFTESELDEALDETVEELHTRSQRQARAAKAAYKWIGALPDDRPLDEDAILQIHRLMVTGADDDHCEPGGLRPQDMNVTFGHPRHRGANGGAECRDAFAGFVRAVDTEFRDHDPIVQAVAAHYHLAAMHPFEDGNGRAARAVEALLLQRAGLRDSCFVAVSNYYYEEKTGYLAALAAAGAAAHDLTPFLIFALQGISLQCTRVLNQIKTEVAKSIYRNLMYDLFTRLLSGKKRVLGKRQLAILNLLLAEDEMEVWTMFDRMEIHYAKLKKPERAFVRDVGMLFELGAIKHRGGDEEPTWLRVNLDWPSEISESKFIHTVKTMPTSKTYPFLHYPIR